MFKICIILLICGIVAAQDTQAAKNNNNNNINSNINNNQERLFSRLGFLRRPFRFTRPLGRLSKRNSVSEPTNDEAAPAYQSFLAKIRQALEEKHGKKALRPVRGLKYYFSLASPNGSGGGCGCGGTSTGRGGGGKRSNVNCKCEKVNTDSKEPIRQQ